MASNRELRAMARHVKAQPGFQYRDVLDARHPYIIAHDLYVHGRIIASQAAAMAATDREFIAECELSGTMGKEAIYSRALGVVLDIWREELVANIKQTKREVTLCA